MFVTLFVLAQVVVVRSVMIGLVSPLNHTQSSSVVSFKARLLNRDEEYLMSIPSNTPSDNSFGPLSPPSPTPLYICFSYQESDQCFHVPALQGSIKVNLRVQPTSTLFVVDVALCRRERNITTVTSRAHDAMVQPIVSMEECVMSGSVEDLVRIHLRSPGFHDNLPALLSGPDGLEGAHTCLLISTLDPTSTEENDSKESRTLQSSLLGYLMSLSSDVYVMVPHTSVCASLSAVSVICCTLHAPELCVPAMVDFAVLYVARDGGPLHRSQEAVAASLSRVRGKLLIVTAKSPPAMSVSDTAITEEKLLLDFHNQKHFLEGIMPQSIFRMFTGLHPVAFPEPEDDQSLLLKRSSHFLVCDITPFPPRDVRKWMPHSAAGAFSPFAASSTASFSFNNGLNLATLSNVCLAENKKEFFLVKDQHSDRILSPQLREILQLSSSGFYPFGEDAGWLFTEVTAAELMQSVASSANISVFPGITALLSPSFAPQMVHTAQTLFPLLHASMHPRLYPWINRLERVMAPTVSRWSSKWVLGLISMLTGFSMSAHSPAQPRVRPSIHLREDMLAPSLLCFEEAIVLGHIDISSPFIASSLEASAFHAHMTAPPSEGPDSFPSTVDKSDEMEKDALHIEKGRRQARGSIKVTLALRGEGRQVLNSAEVVARIEGIAAVDTLWLQEHVVDMDLLSLQDQIKLMNETDIYISAHDAGLLNLVFMQPHSAVIEVFTSPWFEVTYQCTALALDLHYFVLPQSNFKNSFHCRPFAEECLGDIAFSKRTDFRCLGMRGCNVRVDVDALEVIVHQAIQAVRIRKRGLSAARLRLAAEELGHQYQHTDFSHEPYTLEHL